MKRTLIAIAVLAFLATSVHAAIEDPYYFTAGSHGAIKIDGKENPTIRWPYKIVYDELVVCNIPIKMKVGMFVQVKDCKKKKIILDLSKLQWSNSTGIGILVSAWTMAQKEEAELVLVNSSERLDNIFKVTNLKFIMKIFETVDEALIYLKSIW